MLAMANKIYGFIEVHDRYIRPNTLNMLNQFNIAVQKIPTIRAFRIGKKRIVKNGVVQEVDEDASEEAIEETEVILFIYRWKVIVPGVGVRWQSDFHMIGRSACGLPSGWHSKKDAPNKVENSKLVPSADSWLTKASELPLSDGLSAPAVVGKLLEPFAPAIVATPLPSTETP